MKEALRYLNNAKEILKSVPVQNGTYIDIKPVREACGTSLSGYSYCDRRISSDEGNE